MIINRLKNGDEHFCQDCGLVTRDVMEIVFNDCDYHSVIATGYARSYVYLCKSCFQIFTLDVMGKSGELARGN